MGEEGTIPVVAGIALRELGGPEGDSALDLGDTFRPGTGGDRVPLGGGA